jgi:hypothetical protein
MINNKKLTFIFFIILLIGPLNHDSLAQEKSPEGEALANSMLKSVVSSVSFHSGKKALEGLGINAQTVGNPSSNQVDDMGIKGNTSAHFTFNLKPICTRETTVYGLNGAEITIPCQKNENNQVTIKACITESDLKDCRPAIFSIPTNGKSISHQGYEWTCFCKEDHLCDGTMMKSETIIGNSDTLPSQGQKARANNAAYQSIYDMYASKDGYNKTQSYMRSFQNDGQNNWLAKCMQNVKNTIKDGIYYSCDGEQQDDLYNSCKTIKECMKYDIQSNTVETQKICELTPEKQEIKCERFPSIDVQNHPIIYPNCKRIIITQGARVRCPANYQEEVYSDMVLHEYWDDVRICTQVVNTDIPECYATRFFIARSMAPFFGSGDGILPRGLHGRIRVSNVYNQYVLVTVIMKNTGQLLANQAPMTNGQAIELPFSNDEDQIVQFYITGNWRYPWRGGHNTGVLTMMVNQKGDYKTTSVAQNQICAGVAS